MFTIINIIIIIIGKFHARAWPWLHASWSFVCLSQIRAEADIRWCKIVLHAPNQGCSIASCWSFQSGRGFLIAASKALRQSCSGEAPATSPNEYNWFEWLMSSDKKLLAWNSTCWCKLQSFLSSVPFFQQCSKVLSGIYVFSAAKIFLIFLIFIVKFSFYISLIDNLK